MQNLKYRQWIDNQWHYWGLIDGGFINPACSSTGANPMTSDHCQYTGLTDKNGVEIYEGDIIKGEWLNQDEEEVLTCLVRRHYPFYEPTGNSSGFLYNTSLSPIDFDVIGNLHENPELLEAE